MKVQIQSQSVRLRIDENELAELLAGQWVASRTNLGALGGFACALQLHAGDHAQLDGSVAALRFALPREDVLALQRRLPCRDGLSYEFPLQPQPLHLQFDVDVRDSVRQRGVQRRASDVSVAAD